MFANRKVVPLITGVLFAFACMTWLYAGPLNPPNGPVNSGGKTTQEIYDQITANSLAVGAIGGRGPAIPGGNFSPGTFSISSTPAMSGPILGMRSSFSTPISLGSGGGTVGRTLLNTLTIVREMGGTTAPAWRNLTTGTAFTTCTITIPSAGGNTVYVLTSTFVSGLRHTTIQRADGTYAAIEEIDFVPVTLRQTDPNGNFWQFNYQTNTGTGG